MDNNGPAITESEILGEFIAKKIPLNKIGMMAYSASLRRGLSGKIISSHKAFQLAAYEEAKIVREKVLDLIAREPRSVRNASRSWRYR